MGAVMEYRLCFLLLMTATLTVAVTATDGDSAKSVTTEGLQEPELGSGVEETSTEPAELDESFTFRPYFGLYVETCEGALNKYECNKLTGGEAHLPKCVPAVYRCDGYPDCMFMDDEENCDQIPCPAGFFRCDDGICVSPDKRGGSIKHCKGGEDLEPGTVACPWPFFRCSASKCLLPNARCNGISDCPQGEDEQGCLGRACGRGQLNCGDGVCLPDSARCNMREECATGVDELGCYERECTIDEFDCGDSCIDPNLVCNGMDDCGTGRDEVSCPQGCNKSDEFTCRDGTCVQGLLRCNGRKDCEDWSDEEGCKVSCSKEEFSCGDKCVSRDLRCNGISDCLNARDERDCEPTCDVQTSSNVSSSCGVPPLCKADLAFCKLDADSYLEPVKGVCPPRQFSCDGFCLDAALRCDGLQQCLDNADEVGCSSQPCLPGEFLCGDGRCKNATLRCDGTPHCQDGSDEEHCWCLSSEFSCGPVGECVSRTRVCDGRRDCANGLDEADCPRGHGGFCEDSFPCDGNRCIADDHVCDGVPDCADGADEFTQICNSTCGAAQISCLQTCLPASALCNGVHDCPTHVDEVPAVCGIRVRRSSTISKGLGATKGDVALAVKRLELLAEVILEEDMKWESYDTIYVIINSLKGTNKYAQGKSDIQSPFNFIFEQMNEETDTIGDDEFL